MSLNHPSIVLRCILQLDSFIVISLANKKINETLTNFSKVVCQVKTKIVQTLIDIHKYKALE